MASLPPLLYLLTVAAVGLLAPAAAQDVTISWLDEVPDYQKNTVMRLQLTAPSGEAASLKYPVYPLTKGLGLNGTQVERNAVKISGNLVLAEPEYFDVLNKSETIAYVSCDGTDANQNLNRVMDMRDTISAILLYSLRGNYCDLQGPDDLRFKSIFSMSNVQDSSDTLNTTRASEGIVQATIAGNWTMERQEDSDGQSGSNSAVAMSILYSITGLITLLFLVIIATGAIRAHRYPERYGPRSGYGGRPRQSRAKGIARAVLETLPIVKFGDPTQPKKLDPAFELEHQRSHSSPDSLTRARLSAIPEEPRTPKNPQKDAASKPATIPEATAMTAAVQVPNTSTHVCNGNGNGPHDEHLGCSICTEDFLVGEDVRVLPCDHKFHPACIDPWLINVSGTCPLCRLDLRPEGEKGTTDGPDDPSQLAPPLATEWNDPEGSSTAGRERRRSSRLLDFHRLRQASVEERIEILRRHRSQQQPPADGDPEERGRRARLADRLRAFRIRTRTQSPGQSTEGAPHPRAPST
ncbi:hypothetical protein B0T16DRAFT_463002 [Cercophora newfieldiana]|uniref:RING-type domain-containing protein n=1 Tax=Cercophora newfieldiana TaxID=92897 RepID=A0AA39XTD3_9PEZI|nr:hypothetical protein B0T16DRAFT_463002 [Cercophora newfieldiana]